MSVLALVITKAGMDRFTAAQLGTDIDLTVSTVGLSVHSFIAAPTLTALPGEFRRVATISGDTVGDNIVHMVVRDDEDVGYTVSGFGLFLADGTLFASYSQPTPIVEKSPVTSLNLAIDIAFPTADVQSLTFGDTNFLNPPATTDRKGIVELATDAETILGTDPARAVTPKGLAARLAGYVVVARKVLTTGLATGGRALDGDVTIDVAAASAAEADAGIIDNKAVVPSSLANILAAITGRVMLTRRVETSGLALGGGALATDLTISVPAASAAESDAGIIANKAVVPSSLANILAAIAGRVMLTRRVETSGLALGGGALTTDLTISVPAATAVQLLAGGASNVAATPAALAAAGVVYLVEQRAEGNSRYRRYSDGLIEMSGVSFLPTSEATFTLNFPWAFSTACDGIWSTVINSSQTNDGQSTVQEVALAADHATLFAQNHKTPTTDAAGGFRWFARGR